LAVGSGCWAENPVTAATWYCNHNFGTPLKMTVSFGLSADMPEALGCEVVMDGQSDQLTLPDWWNPACRSGITADIVGFPNVCCHDVWGGAASGGAVVSVTGANEIRILIAYALPSSNPVYLLAGPEYYVCHVNVGAMKTVGPGNCPGCEYGFVVTLNQVTLRGVGGVSEDCICPFNNMCVSWQGATTACQWTSPTRNTTWGQVKGLYR
jgi:hypothetical protein